MPYLVPSWADDPKKLDDDVVLTFTVETANDPFNGTIGRLENLLGLGDPITRHLPDMDDFTLTISPQYFPMLKVKNVSSHEIYILSRHKNHDKEQFVFGVSDGSGNIHGLHLESLTDPLEYYVTPLKPGEHWDFFQRLEADDIESIGNGSLFAGIYLTTIDPHALSGASIKTKPMALVWSAPVVKLPTLPSKYWSIPPGIIVLVVLFFAIIGALILRRKRRASV